MQRDRVEAAVLKVLVTLVPKGTAIRLDDQIVDDLKLLSDDATQMALDLQRQFGIKPPLSAWGSVYTVRDVVDLLLVTLQQQKK